MPQKTTAEIGCNSFDQPDMESLNDSNFSLFGFAIVVLKFLGCVIYCWKDIFRCFPIPTVVTPPPIPNFLVAKPQKTNMQSCNDCILGWSK